MPAKPKAQTRLRDRRPTPPAPPDALGASYHPSPEHKTHPGAWGQPRWHPREPDLEACPTDVGPNEPQHWLDRALDTPACWLHEEEISAWEGRRWPSYLYWFVAGRGYFEAQREQRKPAPTGPFTYKGYPAKAEKVPASVVKAMHMAKLLGDDQFRDWKRAFRRRAGGLA